MSITAVFEVSAQTQLPAIVVQGATLAPPKPAKTPSRVEGDGDYSSGDQPSDSGEAGTGVPSDQVGSAVTVITGEELRQSHIRFVADALRGVPGVAVGHTGSAGGLTEVRIRGAESNHTLVIIDGIVANTVTDGAFDFSDLSTDNIERIEIIRSAQSGLYGSNAIGGVINIITKDGRGPVTVTAKAEGGSYRTGDVSAGLSGGNESAHGAVSYQRFETGGWNISPFGSENDGARLETFSAKGGAKIVDGLTTNFAVRNMRKFGDRDGFGGPVGALATTIDDPSVFTSDIWLAGANIKWDALNGHLTQIVRADLNRTERTDSDRGIFGPFFSKNFSETSRYSYLASTNFETSNLLAASHTFSGLIERSFEAFVPSGDLSDGLKRDRERVSYVGEYNGAFANRLFVSGSIRQDNNSTFEDFTTWRLSASLKLPELNLRPHASVGTGVKFPGMFEQFGQIPLFFIPNPNLKPEQSSGWDAGVEWTIAKGRASLDVTYFNADLEDKIETVGFPLTAINVAGISKREGVEIAARYLIMPNLIVSGAYTYLDAHDPDGLRETRRPPHSFKADLSYGFAGGKGNLRLGASYNGAMDDTAFRVIDPFGATVLERVSLDSYWLVSASANYEIKPGVEVFGRVENMLNQQYQEVYGYQDAGISAYSGIRMKFGLEDLALEKEARK